MTLEKVRGELEDVGAALAQGGHADVDAAQAIEEIRTEEPLLDQCRETAIGGGDDPDVYPMRAVAPDPLDCQILTAENQLERLVVFTATPGTEDAERLAMLAVIGTQTFDTGVGSPS